MLTIYNTLNSNFRFQAKIIFLLLVITSLLETFNISLLIPVISVIFSEGDNKYLDYLKNYFNMDEIDRNIFLITFILTLILKNFFTIYCNYKQTLFTASLKLYLNKILFKSYLDLSYQDFKIKNSSTIIRNLVSETDNYIAVIYQYMSLILEYLILFGIFIVLMVYDIKTTLICFFFLIIITILYVSIFQKYLKKIGMISFDNTAYLLKEINESLDNYKIIKLFRNKSIFINNFFKKLFLATDSKRKHIFLSSLARPYLEIFLFSIILTILLMFKVNDYFIKDNFEKISFFIIIFIRIIPSANRIITYLQKIKYSTASVSVISYELSKTTDSKNQDEEKHAGKEIVKLDLMGDLKIDNISYAFNNNKKIINNLSIIIKSSSSIGIMGPSGSGKSLMADLICGLMKPNQGKISIGENEIFQNLKEWQNNIGYITQNIYLLENSIEKNISFGFTSEQINENKIKKLIKICELETFIENLELNEKTLIGERSANISGGQKQRIGIARALYREPNILIFDESFSGIEQETAKIILENIRKNYPKTKIIIISHSEKILENVDQLYSMNNGKLDKL